jgi:hypothetical protein
LEAFLFLLLDSKDLVLAGQIAREEVSPTVLLAFSFFEALFLQALGGADEQTAMTTAGIFLSTRRRVRSESSFSFMF